MKLFSLVLVGLLGQVAFASSLPAQTALNRVEQMLRDQVGASRNLAAQEARPNEPGYLGVLADDRLDPGRGVRIVDVAPESPAAKSGLQNGDLITTIDDQPIRSMQDVARALSGKQEGATVKFMLTREGADREHTITLGRRPRAADSPRANPTPNVPTPPFGEQTLPPSAPRLGVRTTPVTDEARKQNDQPTLQGALVTAVTVGSPAERAEIPLGAVIIEAAGKPVNSPDDLATAVRRAGSGPLELIYLVRGQQVRRTLSPAALVAAGDGRRLELHGKPLSESEGPAPTPEGVPVDGPVLVAPAVDRTAALEARIRELEERIEKLEALLANEPK